MRKLTSFARVAGLPPWRYRLGVRILAAAALALALVPVAAAKQGPPRFHPIFKQRVVLVPAQQPQNRQGSCAVEAPRTRSRVLKPRPVACEQPPRANLNVITGSVLVSLRP
jgi:hypothetical protein